MAFFENTRKPTGFGGRLMVAMMNIGHRALADWGFASCRWRRMRMCWTVGAAAARICV